MNYRRSEAVMIWCAVCSMAQAVIIELGTLVSKAGMDCTQCLMGDVSAVKGGGARIIYCVAGNK